MTKKIRVGILAGGQSGEHEVSLASAQSVLDAIDKDKYDVVLLGIDKQGRWLAGAEAQQLLGPAVARADAETPPAEKEESDEAQASDVTRLVTPHRRNSSLVPPQSPLANVDVVFPVLHGPLGEDGTVQGLLELADIPYVGAGVAASAVGMDKALQKSIFTAHGLPIVPYWVALRSQWEKDPDAIIERVEDHLPYPVFVKPANLGSSVGVSKAHERDELIEGFNQACRYDRKLLVEQGLNVREVECSVLGNDEPVVSVVGEVRYRREFYDYIAKYTDGESDLLIPADLPESLANDIRMLAVRAYRALDVAGMARVDFFIEQESGRVFLNEVNTIPGFTKYSMYPKLWEASGLSYGELIDRLVKLALERHQDKKRSGL